MILLALVALLSAATPIPSTPPTPPPSPAQQAAAPSPSTSSSRLPAVGAPAPDFTVPSDDGTPFTLSSLRGKKTAVLVFFPKAFTGG